MDQIEWKQQDNIFYYFQPKFSNNSIECWVLKDEENKRIAYYSAQYTTLEEAIDQFKKSSEQ